MNKLTGYLNRIYRLTVVFQKQHHLVWEDLKKLNSSQQWRSGIFETDRYIETSFEIAEKKASTFYYMVYDGNFHCRVKILENFLQEVTTELFILASHFNNLLNIGTVVINVEQQYVEYHLQKDLLVPLLYKGELYGLMMRHYNVATDIHWAFQRLVEENEAPAIIIADLLKRKEETVKKED